MDWDWLDALQWPAMVVTLVAAWFIASQRRRVRELGFWTFLLSNVLWVVWGLYVHAYAVVVLQVGLALLNGRGVYKNDPNVGRG